MKCPECGQTMDRSKHNFDNTVQLNYQCQNVDCRLVALYKIYLKPGVAKGIKGR